MATMTDTEVRIQKFRAATCEFDLTSTHYGSSPADVFESLSPLLGRCVERLVNRHDGCEDWVFEAEDGGPIEYRVAAIVVTR